MGVDDGGPAFPSDLPERYSGVRGMTLRDWFAGQALSGLLAHPTTEAAADQYAEWSYMYADVMIQQRKQDRARPR